MAQPEERSIVVPMAHREVAKRLATALIVAAMSIHALALGDSLLLRAVGLLFACVLLPFFAWHALR